MLEYAEEKDTIEWMQAIVGWSKEHPLQMKRKGNNLLPQDIIEELTVCSRRVSS